jgi:hypothetical protein
MDRALRDRVCGKRAQAASILSRPARNASARSWTSAG